MKEVDIERDYFTFDELDGMIAEASLQVAPVAEPLSTTPAPLESLTPAAQVGSILPEPGTMHQSQYRSLLRSFIKSAEAEGVPVTVNVDPAQPPVQADFRPAKPVPPDFSQIFADAPPERRKHIPMSEEQLATLFGIDEPVGDTREHAAVLAAAAPAEFTPRRTLREWWQDYRQDRREAKAKRAHPGLYRAVGAVATVGLLVGGGLFAKSVAPEATARNEATPIVAFEAPDTTLANSDTPTTTAAEQTELNLSPEQTKAVIIMASGRYSIELAHPEFIQEQVDQQFMATLHYAAMVEDAS